MSSIFWRWKCSSGASRRRMPRLIAHDGIARVGAVHVVALLVGHHLQGELVVVAQEQRPLAVRGDLRRLLQDVDDREAVLHVQRHEQPRHEREVEGHVALVAVAEVGGARPRATGWPRPAASGSGSARRCAAQLLQEVRASPAGSRSRCPPARRGTGRRRAAARPPPGAARSRRAWKTASCTAGLSKLRSG